MSNNHKMMTLHEVRNALGLSRQTLENWINKGVFTIHPVNKMRYIDAASVMPLVDTLRQVAETEEKVRQLMKDVKDGEVALREQYHELQHLLGIRPLGAVSSETVRTILEGIVERMVYDGDLNDRVKVFLQEFIKGTDLNFLADRYGISRSRVLQIIAHAARKASDSDYLKSYRRTIEVLKADNDKLMFLYEGAEEQLIRYRKESDTVHLDEDVHLKMNEYHDKYLLLKTPIFDFDLSVRSFNVLKSLDIDCLGDLVQYSRSDIMKGRNMGKKTIVELDDLLSNHGLYWEYDVAAFKEEYSRLQLAAEKNKVVFSPFKKGEIKTVGEYLEKSIVDSQHTEDGKAYVAYDVVSEVLDKARQERVSTIWQPITNFVANNEDIVLTNGSAMSSPVRLRHNYDDKSQMENIGQFCDQDHKNYTHWCYVKDLLPFIGDNKDSKEGGLYDMD